MKEKLTRNLGTKIISVVISVIVWLIITNFEDPVVPREFKDVPVTLLNRHIIEASGETFDITENEAIDFTVRARRSIRDKLTIEDFQVTANLEHLNEFDVVDIRIEAPAYQDEVKVTEGDDLKLALTREELFEDSFKVDVVEVGEVNEGYVIGNIDIDPNLIIVSGPRARIERIDKVIVEANVEDASVQVYRRANPKAYDEEGNEIDQLTFSHNNVYITIDLYQKKEISLNVNTRGKPEHGYEVTDIEFVPKSIEIAGEDSVINDINSITYTEDISGISESVSKTINLEEELPSGVTIVGDDDAVALNITVEELETKSLNLMTSEIDFKNRPPYEKVYITMQSPIRVVAMGKKDDIANLSRRTLKPYIDLSGYSSGTYSVDLQTELSEDIEIIDTPPINVYIGD